MITRIDNEINNFEIKGEFYNLFYLLIIKVFFNLDNNQTLYSDENYLMLLFMKGVCLKEMGLYFEAQTYFEKILEKYY